MVDKKIGVRLIDYSFAGSHAGNCLHAILFSSARRDTNPDSRGLVCVAFAYGRGCNAVGRGFWNTNC